MGTRLPARSRSLAGGLSMLQGRRPERSTSTHGTSSVDAREAECAALQGTPSSSTRSSTAGLKRLQSLGFRIEERTENCCTVFVSGIIIFGPKNVPLLQLYL